MYGRTYRRTDRYLRPTVLGRLTGVDLKTLTTYIIKKFQTVANTEK